MADIPASNWNSTDAGNTDAAPDGAPEGMAPSGVNNVLRAHQGAVKRWYKWSTPATTGGSSTAYTLTYDVAPGALVDGMTHLVQFNAVNGNAPTLNVNGLGATPLHFYCGGSWAALPANMLGVNQIVQVAYHASSGAYRCIDLQPVLSQSVSGVAVIDFTGIPSNVNHIECRFEVKPATNGAVFKLRTYDASGNSDTGASDYAWWTLNWVTTGSSAVTADTTDSNIVMTGSTHNGSTGVGGTIRAENIQALTYTKFTYDTNYLDSAGTNGVGIEGRGQRLEADRITGIRIYTDSGLFTGKATLRMS